MKGQIELMLDVIRIDEEDDYVGSHREGAARGAAAYQTQPSSLST